ncbi:hypothetical protein [Haloplasma contractile]|uniref:Uncharacterized protein n=1 Tax=Haloplasma contractile SSD-17B TaxID=1033810 RepID=U2E8Q7_9MOLU|nr:hypothetical protein [Haloplasma contractile]ERJ11286.1 hypothetical protein HLPCO_002726 [Haloplasma contractile SSD-17B]
MKTLKRINIFFKYNLIIAFIMLLIYRIYSFINLEQIHLILPSVYQYIIYVYLFFLGQLALFQTYFNYKLLRKQNFIAQNFTRPKPYIVCYRIHTILKFLSVLLFDILLLQVSLDLLTFIDVISPLIIIAILWLLFMIINFGIITSIMKKWQSILKEYK